jgi:hypothetical protein
MDKKRRAEMEYVKEIEPDFTSYEEIIEGLIEREKLLNGELRDVKEKLARVTSLQEELSTYIVALKRLRESEHL